MIRLEKFHSLGRYSGQVYLKQEVEEILEKLLVQPLHHPARFLTDFDSFVFNPPHAQGGRREEKDEHVGSWIFAFQSLQTQLRGEDRVSCVCSQEG